MYVQENLLISKIAYIIIMFQAYNIIIVSCIHCTSDLRKYYRVIELIFLRRMMILHLASKCAISATALLHSSICYRLHETFLLESTKTYGQFDKSLLIQLIFPFYRWKSLLLSYPDDNIPTSAAIGAFDIARSVRNVSGALYNVM